MGRDDRPVNVCGALRLELLFLGTAASEGYPDAFCGCDNCERARTLGGPNLRKRCSVLIDGALLIDLGPDLMAAAIAHEISLAGVTWCLQTHEHEDHFDPHHLVSRSPSCGVTAPSLHLYATLGALDRAALILGMQLPLEGLLDPTVQQRLNVVIHPIQPSETFCAGPYRITAVPARHGTNITPLLYLIERDGRTLFYATDTGPLPDAAWETLARWGGRINLVVMDHTFGFRERSTGHLNAEDFQAQIERLSTERLLDMDCRIFAHHLGHHSNPDHETLSAYATQHGYEVAYDGLRIAI